MSSENISGDNDRARPDAVAAKRYSETGLATAIDPLRRFVDDSCANCFEPLPDFRDELFCSELCRQTADTIRYWRRIVRDGRIKKPDVRLALNTRTAFLLAGGYHSKERTLARSTRLAVWSRDGGTCRSCAQPGEEIDHIANDSDDLDNLQLLCKDCHQAKTAERMRPASDDHKLWIAYLFATRVAPDEPTLLADDEIGWQTVRWALKKGRRDRLIAEMVEAGLDPADFRHAARPAMVAALHDALEDAYAEDGDEVWSSEQYESDLGEGADSGYGPNSYFAHAMSKDD